MTDEVQYLLSQLMLIYLCLKNRWKLDQFESVFHILFYFHFYTSFPLCYFWPVGPFYFELFFALEFNPGEILLWMQLKNDG